MTQTRVAQSGLMDQLKRQTRLDPTPRLTGPTTK